MRPSDATSPTPLLIHATHLHFDYVYKSWTIHNTSVGFYISDKTRESVDGVRLRRRVLPPSAREGRARATGHLPHHRRLLQDAAAHGTHTIQPDQYVIMLEVKNKSLFYYYDLVIKLLPSFFAKWCHSCCL